MQFDYRTPLPPGQPGTGPWSPFRYPAFRAIWLATLISNIGTWMQSTAAAWLMASIAPDALMVSMVQTAVSLPMFLLALPAGALADAFDRRRLILFTQCWMLSSAALLGMFTVMGWTTPWVLLLLTLLLGLGTALNAPAWQAMVPELVDLQQIPSAVALNSANFNVARSVGPALGGLVIGAAGFGAAFLINAATYVGVIGVLLTWRSPLQPASHRGSRVLDSIGDGFQFVLRSPLMHAVLCRTAAFTVAASCLMALLPLLAKRQLEVDSVHYGLMVGSFGAGAVLGAMLLPAICRRAGMETVATVATVVFSAVLCALSLFSTFPVLCAVLILGGVAWLVFLSNMNSTVQTSVPFGLRGRALSTYLLVFFGGLAGGSLLWGTVASRMGVQGTLVCSSAALLVGLLLTFRLRFSASG